MSDEHSRDIDLGAAHLRPAQRGEPRSAEDRGEDVAEPIPWEGPRARGLAASYIASWWSLVRTPVAAYATVPATGGIRRPAAFLLVCGAIFGVSSELIDSSTVALVRYGGGAGLSEVFQFDIAGRSLEWLPISVLSAAGCFLGLVVGGPLYLLLYSVLGILWTTALHVLVRTSGGLAASAAGFQGTLRTVCYSQVAMVAAIVPWIGDPIAVLWSCALQVVGLARMHRCSRPRAALAVGLLLSLVIAALLLLILRAESDAALG